MTTKEPQPPNLEAETADERALDAVEDPRIARAAKNRARLIAGWALAPVWSSEEGVVLAFDLDPDKALERSGTGYGATTSVRGPDEVRRLRDFAWRAIRAGALEEDCPPIRFMEWARSMGVEFHGDWWSAVAREGELPEKVVKPQQSAADELKTRERETLLKLVIGMAMEGYKWDPKAARNSATAEIESDLHRLGISLTQETILKWLRAGADLLQRDD